MYRLLIADDEPLVQIGMKSMLDWGALEVEICGVASNGDAAWDMINRHHPDIVITDIQMPCSTGLELGRRCMEELGELPVFIILSSYESFQYAREALNFRAVDYLVKLDLTPESLEKAVIQAIAQVKAIQKKNPAYGIELQSYALFHERFYIRLLNQLFDSREQFLQQQKEFGLHLDAKNYTVAILRFHRTSDTDAGTEEDIPVQEYEQALNMFREIFARYIRSHVVAMDTRLFALVCFLDDEDEKVRREKIYEGLRRTAEMLYNYYRVNVLACVGSAVTDPIRLAGIYSEVRQFMPYVTSESSILFCDEMDQVREAHNVFNMSLFRNDIRAAFQELDEKALCSIIDNICALLGRDSMHFSQALDAAVNILHFSLTLLEDGPELVTEIFADEPDNYRTLYHLKETEAVTDWLKKLEEGLVRAFHEHKNSHQRALIALCCQYVREHLHEKIYLQDIADTYGVSPNYLSHYFKKNKGIGISEYINVQKIEEAKRLLRETNLKIYEISDQLGFENSFYFSKVFKKIAGLAPKDFRT